MSNEIAGESHFRRLRNAFNTLIGSLRVQNPNNINYTELPTTGKTEYGNFRVYAEQPLNSRLDPHGLQINSAVIWDSILSGKTVSVDLNEAARDGCIPKSSQIRPVPPIIEMVLNSYVKDFIFKSHEQRIPN